MNQQPYYDLTKVLHILQDDLLGPFSTDVIKTKTGLEALAQAVEHLPSPEFIPQYGKQQQHKKAMIDERYIASKCHW
jgi:hypothetical protein